MLKPEVGKRVGVVSRNRPGFTPRVASIGYSKKYFDLLYTDRVLRNRCIAIGRYFGKDPSYDARALRRDLASIRSAMMSVWR